MPRLKRPRDEVDLDTPNETDVESDNYELLNELRNMWEFASLMQYIFLFGEVVKIDNDFDIEDLEAECLKSTPSEKLAEIGLALLKLVSSHRGLNLEIFEEYARRQYLAKAPRRNPFGDEEEPKKFNDLDIFTRIRIMHQLSTWTLGNADRIRSMMPEGEDPIHWRMEPLGWDKEDRAYFVLDDNRLYRRTDEVPPPPSPKVKEKRKPPPRRSSARATRASKRRRIDDSEEEEEEDDIEERESDEEGQTITVGQTNAESEDESEWGFGFTSKTWECVAVTLDDYQEFMSTIFRSRNPNEKLLRASIEADVVPIIEKRAEVMKQKQLRKMREFENLQKLATAKRSSRLADKAEKEKQEREEREAEEKRQRDIQMALEERERQKRIEEGHESRRLTREQRLRERESKRILLEEELAKLDETDSRNDSEEPNDDKARRISNRQIQTQKAQHTMELEMLAEEENEWVFDCSVCGVNGGNLDDGTHSIACDRCNVWQHSKCHGLTKQQAEHNDFRFVCAACKQKEADGKKPKIPPLKLAKAPSKDGANETTTASNGQRSSGVPEYVQRQLDGVHIPGYPDLRSAGPFGQLTGHPPSQNGISPPPLVKSPHQAHPYQNFAPQPPPPPPHNYQPPAAHNYQSPPTHNYQSPTGQFVQPQVSPRPNSSHGWPQNPAPMHQPPPPPHWQPNSRPPSGHAGSPPPPMNGYGMGPAGPPMPMNGYSPAPPPPPPPPPPPYHQQNHQYSHNSAVASTPGHMVYVSQHYGPEPPVPPPGMYVVAHTTSLSPYGYPPPMPYPMPPYPQPLQEPPQGNSQKGPGPSQRLMVYEPKKSSRKSSPGTMRVRPWVPKIRGPENSSRATQSSQSNPQASSSSSSEEVEIIQSPSKPSENSAASQPPINSSSPHNDPPRLMTPQQNSTQVMASTPQNPSDGQAPPSSASKLAEDGMSGPWPESSKNIPQKQDQRPAPPLPPQSSSSSSQGLEGVGIYPPNTPLAPSPRSQEAAKTGTIPVKKTPAPQQVAGASKGKEAVSQASKRVVAGAD